MTWGSVLSAQMFKRPDCCWVPALPAALCDDCDGFAINRRYAHAHVHVRNGPLRRGCHGRHITSRLTTSPINNAVSPPGRNNLLSVVQVGSWWTTFRQTPLALFRANDWIQDNGSRSW